MFAHHVFRRRLFWAAVSLIGVVSCAGFLQERWLQSVQSKWARIKTALADGKAAGGESAHDEHGPAGHDHAGHDHAGHSEAASIELSAQARKNIGLTVAKVQLSTFERSITVPGMVTERRGQTRTRIVAPLTGIVTRIHVIEGEALQPGRPLFDLRLTHEDLVQAQVEFLKLTEELDVVNREVARLQPIVNSGSISQKTLLDRKYEQQKLEASQRAQREALLLHGLNAVQVDEIMNKRQLKSTLTISVPEPRPEGAEGAEENSASAKNVERLWIVEGLRVETGRLVTAGDMLLTLSDYSELYIQGDAFERDARLIAQVLEKHWKVTALFEDQSDAPTAIPDLSVLYVADEVDPVSRLLHFFVRLPNEKVRDETERGHRFINWRFKPGERAQLRVPVEHWPGKIVLPADALVRDGAESYVFQENGDHFDRRPVQVEYRDQTSVIIAQDGSVFIGDRVAVSGAQQLQMALRNKAGGAIDPHAGHNH